MKRELLLIAATISFMASCTQESELVGSSQTTLASSDIIGFRTNTTRATTLILENIEGSDVGFAVYATSSTDSDGDTWFLTGTKNYLYDDIEESWGWDGDSESWPTDATAYPLSFYTLFSTGYTGVTVSQSSDLTDSDTAVVSASVTVQEAANQVDILAASATADTKPSDGKLSLAFDHILSKIDFGVIVGYEMSVYIAGLKIHNLLESGVYDIGGSSWTQSTDTTADYDLSDYMSYTTAIAGSDSAESSATSLTTTNSYSLMLLPQSVTESDTDTWATASEIENSYIELLYRMETSSDSAYIGYSIANDHPDYNEEEDEEDYDQQPLFIKVGYPVSATWNGTYNYTYNIKLGTTDSTNGYILSDVYYLSDGTPTDFAIDYTDKEIGDPISSGEICFNITVNSWVGSTSETVN